MLGRTIISSVNCLIKNPILRKTYLQQNFNGINSSFIVNGNKYLSVSVPKQEKKE